MNDSHFNLTGTQAYSLQSWGNPADPALLILRQAGTLNSCPSEVIHTLLAHHYQLFFATPRESLLHNTPADQTSARLNQHEQILKLLNLLPLKPALIASGDVAAHALICLAENDKQLATALVTINFETPQTLAERVKLSLNEIQIPFLDLGAQPAHSLSEPKEQSELLNKRQDGWNSQINKIVTFLNTRTALGLPT